MTNKVQHHSWIPRIGLRPVTTASAIGALLLSAVPAAWSQEEKTPKPPAYTVLYTFTGGADGANPNYGTPGTGLIRDREGNLYGTTTNGGDVNGYCSYGCGVVFKLDRSGKETVLHSFTGPPDGADPVAGLVRDEEGNLYSTTAGGGTQSAGTVFKLNRAGKEVVLYSFTGGADGNTPNAGVIRDEEGNLYGTTLGGGEFCGNFGGCGAVFVVDPAGNETVLYSFTGGADGRSPEAGLIRDEEGNLYGMTLNGGASGFGVVYKLEPSGKETVLYSFTGRADGAQPVAGLIRDEEGNLYGIASGGGASNNGVVFKLGSSGNFKVLYTFTGGTDGSTPYGRLFRHRGHLYRTTFFGGDLSGCGGLGCGVVFKLDLAGKETVLYSFTGGADGANPYAGLIRDEEGNFYGTTGYGGDLSSPQPSCNGIGCGVVFKLEPCRKDDGDFADESSTSVTEDSAAPATQHPMALAPDGRVPMH